MPGQLRPPTSVSLTLVALVRRHFALTQAELGQWLGVSQATIEAVEAGRRQLSARPAARLSPPPYQNKAAAPHRGGRFVLVAPRPRR